MKNNSNISQAKNTAQPANTILCKFCHNVIDRRSFECKFCGNETAKSLKTSNSVNKKTYKEINRKEKRIKYHSEIPLTPLVIDTVLDFHDHKDGTRLIDYERAYREVKILKVFSFLFPQFMLALYRKYVALSLTIILFIIAAVMPFSRIGSIICIIALIFCNYIGLVLNSVQDNKDNMKNFTYSEKRTPCKGSIFKDTEPVKSTPPESDFPVLSGAKKNIIKFLMYSRYNKKGINAPLAIAMIPFSVLYILLIVKRLIFIVKVLILSATNVFETFGEYLLIFLIYLLLVIFDIKAKKDDDY